MSRSTTSRRPMVTAVLAFSTLVAGLALSAPPATAAPVDGPTVTARTAVTVPLRDADTTDLQYELDQLVADGAPGALLYSYDKGNVTALQSGLADLSAGTPMGPSVSYRIGSLTKTYVSTAVLQLVAKHRLKLDDPASRYLPGLLAGQPRVTLRQLLNHTSGVFDFYNDPRVLAPYLDGDLGHVWTPASLVRIALSHDAVSRPGVAYHYSNTNYLLAGLIVEAVTGRPLGEVLRHRVFSRAHLSATTFNGSTTLPTPAAHGYFELSDDQPTDITALYPYPWASGSAVGTAPDVARFYRELLSGELLPRRLLAAMKTGVDASAEDGPGTTYGLGLERFTTSAAQPGDTAATSPATSPTSTPRRTAAARPSCSSTRTRARCPRRSDVASGGCSTRPTAGRARPAGADRPNDRPTPGSGRRSVDRR